jgi:hypothetical protein
MQPTDEAKQLQALSAQIAALKDKQLKLSRTSNVQNKDKSKDKKGKKSKRNKQNKDSKWAWLTVPPKDNDPNTKVIDSIEWHWCKNHKKWQHHTTEQCHMGTKQEGKKKKGKPFVAQSAFIENEGDSESKDSI